MGDAQTERLAEYLDANSDTCDVLKIPHHGKDEPLMEALLQSTKPSRAVITSSAEEPESESVVRALEQAGAQVLLTREGAITLRSGGQGVSQV